MGGPPFTAGSAALIGAGTFSQWESHSKPTLGWGVVMFHDAPGVYARRGSPKIMFLDGVHRPCTFLGILVAQLAELVF